VDAIVGIGRIDIDRSTVTVSVTILVDNSIDVVSVVADNVGITPVSSGSIDNHRIAMSTVGIDDGGTSVIPTVVPVTIDNDSLAVTVSTSTVSLDDRGVMSMSTWTTGRCRWCR
jgi:hypothetical protein